MKSNSMTFTAALPANYAVVHAAITMLLNAIHPEESEY